MKTLFKVLLSLALVWGVARFCHYQTAGFKMSKIANNLEQAPPQAVPIVDMGPILKQPFTYLGRGFQAFVFESQDKQYVLKLFTNTYQRRLFWLSLCPFPLQWKTNKNREYSEKLLKGFHSYQLAFDEFKEESGLIYVHLNPTSYLQKITIIDKLGIAHEIDANQMGFLIQKKATLVYPYLSELLAKGEEQRAKEAIHALLDFFVERAKRGIGDTDPLIRTNFGFIGERPIQIDVGPLYKDPLLKESYRTDIPRIAQSLKHWLEQHSPELAHYLNRELEGLRDEI